MSVGVCHPATRRSGGTVTAHAIAGSPYRRQATATAAARMAERSACPLGSESSNATTWTRAPSTGARSAGRTTLLDEHLDRYPRDERCEPERRRPRAPRRHSAAAATATTKPDTGTDAG